MSIIVAIVVFSIIIIIHELGHFLLAKKNGIGVVEFSIGLGPRLCSFLKNGTKYSIKLLPFGGSCQMLGEDELMDADNSFNKKSVWARISVIAAGPIFNFLLAFLLALFITGMAGYDPASVTTVEKGMPAEAAGLKEGDIVTNIDGNHISIGREIGNYFQFNKLSGDPIDVTYKRDGKKAVATLTPVKTKTYMMGFTYEQSDMAVSIKSITEDMPLAQAGLKVGDVITKVDGTVIANGMELNTYFRENPLGENNVILTYTRGDTENTAEIIPKLAEESYKTGFGYNLYRVKANPFQVVKYSAVEVKYWISTTVKSLGQMFAGKVSKDDISGPVGIVNVIGDSYEQTKKEGAMAVLLQMSYITILLSANLGVMNLLPIPALDGGRLVFLIIEAVRGKPVNQEKEGLVHAIGLIALMILMVFILFNDVSKLF